MLNRCLFSVLSSTPSPFINPLGRGGDSGPAGVGVASGRV